MAIPLDTWIAGWKLQGAYGETLVLAFETSVVGLFYECPFDIEAPKLFVSPSGEIDWHSVDGGVSV
jgi:hypothetical protein